MWSHELASLGNLGQSSAAAAAERTRGFHTERTERDGEKDDQTVFQLRSGLLLSELIINK